MVLYQPISLLIPPCVLICFIVCVCVTLFYDLILGNPVPGFPHEQAKGERTQNSQSSAYLLIKSSLTQPGCLCCFVLLNQYWGIVTFPGVLQGGSHPRLRIADSPPHPVPGSLRQPGGGGSSLCFWAYLTNYVCVGPQTSLTSKTKGGVERA